MSLFSTFVLERPPLELQGVAVQGFLTWLRVVGGFAAFCILIWAMVRFLAGSSRRSEKTWAWPAFVYTALGAFIAYLIVALFWLPELFEVIQLWSDGKPIKLSAEPEDLNWKLGLTLLGLSGAGALAFIAVFLPFLHNLLQVSWRRIWSISRLSFKEAVRRKIVYVFLALMLVILFANWFVPHKPEDQVRNYVSIVDKVMKPLLILPAALLAAFAIPTDIKKQTIHTIVTKPVERFEIIAGRIVGYSMLMTLMLFVMATISLFFVLRGINPEARAESLKARIPIYGQLYFMDQIGRGQDKRFTKAKSTNVGREWGYRGYVEGQNPNKPGKLHYAVWDMVELPGDLEARPTIRCESHI